jgi:hypothetical protein
MVFTHFYQEIAVAVHVAYALLSAWVLVLLFLLVLMLFCYVHRHELGASFGVSLLSFLQIKVSSSCLATLFNYTVLYTICYVV